MTGTIKSFDGQYRWLSNFWPSKVILDEEEYPSIEHAFQAAKTLVKEEREKIKNAYTPGFAKKLGRTVKLRTDWEKIKLDVMLNLLRQKFQEPELKEALLNTKNKILIEGNTWNDTFWGVCNGEGKNHLGLLIMQVREEIK